MLMGSKTAIVNAFKREEGNERLVMDSHLTSLQPPGRQQGFEEGLDIDGPTSRKVGERQADAYDERRPVVIIMYRGLQYSDEE